MPNQKDFQHRCSVSGQDETRHPLTLHDELVRTGDECQPVVVIERLRDVLPEGVSCPSRRNAPSAAIVRVRPKEVTHGPFVRHLLHAVDGTDMIEGVDGGRKSSVKAKYL